MDITDDAHTISLNKLTIPGEENASSRENLVENHHSQPPPPGYGLFYHG